MPVYNPPKTEEKWQKRWEEEKLYQTDLQDSKRPKYYNLVMFPYPSGDKLHIGHWYNYAPADSWGRYMRMKGFNVFEPMGFDSFGLPAENYAIKTGKPPRETTEKNVEYMRKQLGAMGTMYDWDKEVVTSHPDYYKWTQWVFLELYKKGLAYKRKAPVNWCPSCQTVLANEQVKEGHCDRCNTEVTKKDLVQWFFNIREYAEDLLDSASLDWPEKTRLMQKDWIGKSHGVNIHFPLADGSEVLTAYTTRPDTIYSVTFICIAPEHPLVEKLSAGTKYEKEVKEVVGKIKKQTLIERTSETGKDKFGAFTGQYAINPVNGEKIPVYVANFALMYGTGIVMADAHDQRDFEFARRYNIPLKFVISEDGKPTDPQNADKAYTADGILFGSEEFDGMNNRQALPKIATWLEKKKFGQRTINYKLRDWLISRQRYWGAPIPIINCEKCGDVPVPEKDLPVMLPEKDVDYKPKGKSPLASVPDFVNTKCPKCGEPAQREVDTMDTFVDSSWYFLRYLDSKDTKKPFDMAMNKKWMPVDMYIGGPEHACMHLLYARFIHKVLMNDRKAEPFKRLVHQGLITKDGAKMSKSKGNVVSPDAFVEKYGSDIFRMYLMFMGPFTDGGDWNDKGITGIARFVENFYLLASAENSGTSNTQDAKNDDVLLRNLHRTIKKVTEDIEKLHFNTAISALMQFVNEAKKTGVTVEAKKVMAQLIAPLAPHLGEELWEMVNEKSASGKPTSSKKTAESWSVFDQKWPEYDKNMIQDDVIVLPIQVNGKLRGQIEAAPNETKENILEAARKADNVAKYLEGKKILKEIYVPGRLVSFVVGE